MTRPPPASTPGRLAGSRLVLVVDDYDSAAEMLGQFIELTCHCEVLTALDGAEAVRTSSARHPDAIVMDIDMPIMDGIEAARRVRQQPGRAPLLIAMTGGTQIGRARCSACFDHVLAKPADINALTDLLNAYLMPPVRLDH